MPPWAWRRTHFGQKITHTNSDVIKWETVLVAYLNPLPISPHRCYIGTLEMAECRRVFLRYRTEREGDMGRRRDIGVVPMNNRGNPRCYKDRLPILAVI